MDTVVVLVMKVAYCIIFAMVGMKCGLQRGSGWVTALVLLTAVALAGVLYGVDGSVPFPFAGFCLPCLVGWCVGKAAILTGARGSSKGTGRSVTCVPTQDSVKQGGALQTTVVVLVGWGGGGFAQLGMWLEKRLETAGPILSVVLYPAYIAFGFIAAVFTWVFFRLIRLAR
jgi:hypothetical protein